MGDFSEPPHKIVGLSDSAEFCVLCESTFSEPRIKLLALQIRGNSVFMRESTLSEPRIKLLASQKMLNAVLARACISFFYWHDGKPLLELFVASAFGKCERSW